jgi:acyl carrier protein
VVNQTNGSRANFPSPLRIVNAAMRLLFATTRDARGRIRSSPRHLQEQVEAFMSSIKTVREILASHGKLPVEVDSLADEADLYAAGLSSFASVQLMLALEDQFDIEFPENRLNRKTFSSIAAISTAIDEICAEQKAA